MSEELWIEVRDIVQEVVMKSLPNEKKKEKWLSVEALQIPEEKEKLQAKEKRKDIPIWMQSSKE